MLTILIPPAKELNETIPSIPYYPLQDKLSSAIVDAMTAQTDDQLLKIYALKNVTAAQKEAKRWDDIDKGHALHFPAFDLYNGLMYRSVKKNLSADAKTYIQSTTFITTALYGIIPAFSPIAPHRLDFATKINLNEQSLKKIWKSDYDHFIQTRQNTLIISLLSDEFEQVFSKASRDKIVTINFMKDNGYLKPKKHASISKKGRGFLLKALSENNCKSLDEIKSLSFNGFQFSPKYSNANTVTFLQTSV